MSSYPPKDVEAAATCVAGVANLDEDLSTDVLASFPRALVRAVVPHSPADDAGFVPGCYVTHADGNPVRDSIDWRWFSDGDTVRVGYLDLDGEAGEVELERELGEDWGFEFEGVVFDGVKQCRNACTFCFMHQLPAGMRASLSLRDDDFRLSFLSGTFVTFTNLSADDEARIIEQRITPLRVSLHAVDEQVRRRLIGKHAARGLEVLERLLTAGIEFHVQIVLLPGQNDGAVLEETLRWAYEHPGILNVGIVPLGYTKHQSIFDHSFNDAPDACAVLDTIAPFQMRASTERGDAWVFAADEFFRNAYGAQLLEYLPPAEQYGDFSLFEDGIGMVRSYVDDWQTAQKSGASAECATALCKAQVHVFFIVGQAMQPLLDQLVVTSPLVGVFEPLTVANTFFGGNVDVTGLLCGCDIVKAVRKTLQEAEVKTQTTACKAQAVACKTQTADRKTQTAASSKAHQMRTDRDVCEERRVFLIPRVVFNDEGLTLDDMTLEDMEKAAGVAFAVVSCNPSEFLPEIGTLAAHVRAKR